MRTRLLELFCGLATLTIAIAHYYYFDFPDIAAGKDNQKVLVYLSIFVLLIPAVLTALGSLTHALRNSRTGFVLLTIGSSIIIIYYGLALFSFATFYWYGWTGGLLYTTPGIFAAATLFLAIRSRKYGLLFDNAVK